MGHDMRFVHRESGRMSPAAGCAEARFARKALTDDDASPEHGPDVERHDHEDPGQAADDRDCPIEHIASPGFKAIYQQREQPPDYSSCNQLLRSQLPRQYRSPHDYSPPRRPARPPPRSTYRLPSKSSANSLKTARSSPTGSRHPNRAFAMGYHQRSHRGRDTAGSTRRFRSQRERAGRPRPTRR